nr:oligosaccharide flippase family protein [uncultured Acetatifactor sp.]
MIRSKYKIFLTDIIFFGIGTLGSKLIMFLLLPLYTKALTSEEYGIADLVFSLSELIRPFISLAIYNGLQRYGLSKDYDKDEAFRCVTIIFLIGAVISSVVTPLLGFYDSVSDWKWYLWVYAVTVIALKNTFIYLKISNNNRSYAILSILQAFILAISNILLLIVWKRGIQGYLIANIFAPACIVIIGILISGAHRGLRKSSYNKILMKEMVVYSLPFIINDISWWFIHSSDKIMIEGMIDASSLGIYTAASKIPLLINVIMAVFGQAWDLFVIKEYEGENNKNYYSNISRFYIVSVFGLCIFIISIIRPFMRIYVGGAFRGAWQYVPLLLLAAAFSSLDMFVTTFFSALKKSRAIMWPTIVAGIVNIVMNYYLIKIVGVWGAVLATVAAYLLMMIIRIILLRKTFKFKMYLSKGCFLILITGIQAFLVGIDFHGTFVSIIVICLYMVLVFGDIRTLCKFVLSKFKNK